MDSLPPPAAYVAIDPVAWTRAAGIRWPSGEATVAVFPGSSSSDHPLLRVPANEHVFRFGQLGDRLVVIMGLEPGYNGGSRGWDFLAAHESFRIAAQAYGTKVPFAYLSLDPELVRRYSPGPVFATFHDAIARMHAGMRATGKVECAALEDAFEALDDDARTYLTYKAFWEWPAEFYAYSVTFRSDPEAYEPFRASLFEDDTGYRLFISGVKVAELLEARLSRDEWQARAAQGESMLALLADAYRCRITLDESLAVTIQQMELPYQGDPEGDRP